MCTLILAIEHEFICLLTFSAVSENTFGLVLIGFTCMALLVVKRRTKGVREKAAKFKA